ELDADGGHLFVPDPNAGVGRLPLPFDPEGAERDDQGFLQIAQIAVGVVSPLTQMKERITHQLTRTVIGDVSAAVDFHHIDPPPGIFFGGEQQMFRMAAPPQGDRVGMLQQEELVGSIPFVDPAHPLLLHVPGFPVRDRPESIHLKHLSSPLRENSGRAENERSRSRSRVTARFPPPQAQTRPISACPGRRPPRAPSRAEGSGPPSIRREPDGPKTGTDSPYPGWRSSNP